MELSTDLKSEIKLWLEKVLEKYNLKDLKVQILGNSEKGDGYLGDIVFVHVSGISENQSIQEFDFVLKCSKRSEALRSQGIVQNAFINEIHFYEQILPAFNNFQKTKGIEGVFDSVPKFYGRYVDDSKEILVLENLKKIGYDLWDKRKPVTRKHIEMVMKAYAEFHAISVAMQEQKPEEFKILAEPLEKLADTFTEKIGEDSVKMCESGVEDVYNALKDDIEEKNMLRWKKLKDQVRENFTFGARGRVKAILHGDCWNNNFMYLSKQENGKELPEKVAILDWQISKFSSPILDLSYFLFACISEEDLKDLDNVLKCYYTAFAHHVEKLGSNPSQLYPFEEFLDDWKKFCKYGILISCQIHKICLTDTNDVVNIAEAAEEGKSFIESFLYEVKDMCKFKKRVRPIVEYVVKSNLV